jgi:hypothetical protein
MGSHPLNLTVRFILELSALFAIGSWGWRQSTGAVRVLLAIGLPVFAAILWGTFAVPDDPSRSGNAPVPIPGFIRLLLEWLVFGSAAWAVFHMGYGRLSLIFAGSVIVHYAVSYDRILWLFSQ